MPSAVNWEGVSPFTQVASAVFSALASSAMASATGEIDNSTGLDTYMWWELKLDPTAAPEATNPSVDLYVSQSLDGTNYPEDPVTGGTDCGHMYLGSFPTQKIATNQRIVIGPFAMPPFKFKIFADNQTGIPLSAGGSTTLSYATNNLEGQ